MSFSLNRFRASFYNGIQRPNRYEVTISFLRANWQISNHLSFACATASLPSRSFRTEQEFLYGVARKVPINLTYDDFSLGFICSADMKEKKFFDRWTSYIQDPTSNYMHYYDEYAAVIQVQTFDESGRPSYGIYVEEAYPVGITPIPLAYSEKGSYMQLNVDFAYRKWRNEDEKRRGDALNQGYEFSPHITPVEESHVLTGDWVAPQNLDSQQGDGWNHNVPSHPFEGIWSDNEVAEQFDKFQQKFDNISLDLKDSVEGKIVPEVSETIIPTGNILAPDNPNL
jgi:hypothetical protein